MEMNFMKKIVCLLLAMILSVSLAIPAAAATKSPEKKPSYFDNPKTGDVISLWVGTMALSSAGLAFVVNHKKEQ